MLKIPESLEWLAENNKAHAALRMITPRQGWGRAVGAGTGGDKANDASMSDRTVALEAEMWNPSLTRRDETRIPLEYREESFFVMDNIPQILHYWRQAIIVEFLAMAQQFCGHINITNYASVIFAKVFYHMSFT